MFDDISVLMSVYSVEKAECLSDALESIFSQTLRPKEVVLVKDGPLGKELDEVIELWKEKEPDTFKIVDLDKNIGLARALNCGLRHCSCELVARMDSDDIAQKDRLQKEVKCIKDSGVDVVGSYIEERDENMALILGERKVPLEHDDIVCRLRWKNPMNHVTVMFRKSAVIAVGEYPEELKKIQDYGLWAKMISEGYRFKNIDEALVMVRTGENFIDRRGGLAYFKYEFAVLNYIRKLGILGFPSFVLNLMIRFFSRICPKTIRVYIYRWVRNE